MLHPTDSSQHFLSLYGPTPPQVRARQPSGLSGSIWAPQPQPSVATWPKALDSFSRVAERDSEQLLRLDSRTATNLPIVSREDVFGAAPTSNSGSREIGAIGDGRIRNALDCEDTVCALFSFFLVRVYLICQSQHVEQLLRTLNLNSPAPPPQKPAIDLNVDTSPSSPDFSPASVSSALLTPTDLSPVRSFELKFPAQYEHGQHQPYFSQSSLLFENGSPGKHQDTLAAHSPYLPFSHSNQPSNALPFFEPFTEPPTPAPINSVHTQYRPASPSSLPHSLYSSPLPPRRMESARPLPMDWRLTQQLQQQPASTHPDWRLACEKNFSINTQEDTLRPSFSYQQPTVSQAFQSSHEVCHLFVFLQAKINHICAFRPVPANQLSLPFTSFVVSSLSCLRRTHHQIVGPTGVHLSSTEAQGR